MKVQLYMDLHDTCIECNELLMASSKTSYPVMKEYTRYLIEVDLPIHHFKEQYDMKIEAVLIGKEEK